MRPECQRYLIAKCIAATIASAPLPAESAVELAVPARVETVRARSQIVIAVRPDADTSTTWLAVLPADHEVMAYRFRATLMGSSPARGRWNVRVTDHGRDREVVRLGDGSDDILLSRPWGVRLNGGDTLIVEFERLDASVRPDSVVVLIEYEAVGGERSRVGVLPATAARAADDSSASALTWTWTTPAHGRLVAIQGLDNRNVVHVAVADAGTNEPLFSRALASDALAGAVRLGVAVRAGRTYRVTVTQEAGAPAVPVAQLVMLLVPTP